ncbi:MAG: anti-phage defense ZorAB system ZorA [Selenomonadaceae bacterium]|nr:anti-phage defense ZorAB system ZorA [Selenomonadaceae bacterium]
MADIFLSTWALGSLVFAVLLIGAYVYWCGRKIFNDTKEIERVIKAQDLVAAVKESNLLKPLWESFAKTLTAVGDKTYSTVDAAEIFNPQTFTRGMNMTFWQNYGGIFTGLGILGTFLGLTIGLSGVDMTGGDIETLKSGIAKLLSGVETAFVTSLVGIFCAIVYSVGHHWLMKNFQSAVQNLTDKLDEIFPRRSAEDWLNELNATAAENFSESQAQTSMLHELNTTAAENFSESQAQTSMLHELNETAAKNFSESQGQTSMLHELNATAAKDYGESLEQTKVLKNIGEQVADAIHKALDEKLAEYVEKICEAIDKLGTGVAAGINDTMTKVAGAQMDRFSAALEKFSDSIDAKLKSVDAVSKTMNEQMLSTVEKVSKTLEQQAETSTSNVGQISEAVNAFSEIVKRHNETTQKMFAQVQSLLNETEKFLQQVNTAGDLLKQAAEPVKQSTLQLTKNLIETSAQMENLATANQTTRQNLFDLTNRLSTFVNDFNGIADELERSTNVIKDSLEHYNYEISDGLTKALTQFDQRLKDSAGYLSELVEELTDALEDFKKFRR